jgi:hypothetical protein
LSVSVLLYIPPVQNRIIEKAAQYASESAGINIRFERIRLAFPLNLSAYNVSVTNSGNDTLLYLNKLTLRVRLKPLLKGNISVHSICMEQLHFNTGSLIDGIAVEGHAGEVRLRADSINPAEEYAVLNNIYLSDADIRLFMCDTTAADTSASATKWQIDLRQAELHDITFSCRLPCDSVYLGLQIDSALLSGVAADTEKGRYGASALQLRAPEIAYGTNPHIRLADVRLTLDSLHYESEMNMYVVLRECSAREQSGITLRSAAGSITSDSARLHLPSFLVQTDHSTVKMQADIPWSAVDSLPGGDDLSVVISASVGKEDLMRIAGVMPENYPDTALRIALSAGGNIGELKLHRCEASLPGAFRMSMTGNMKSVTDERARTGQLRCEAAMQDMNFVTAMLPSPPGRRFRIPDSMHFTAGLSVNKGTYDADLIIRESEGSVKLSGKYDRFADSYEAHLNIDSLEPVHFMPGDSLMSLNAYLHVKGQGVNLYRSSTWVELEGKVHEISWGNLSVSEISLAASLRNSQLQATVNSAWPPVRGRISAEGDISKEIIKGTLTVDADTLDFCRLGLTETPLSTSFRIFSEIKTNLKKEHVLDVTLGNWSMTTNEQTIQPKMLTLAFRSNEDTVRTSFHAGDMSIMLTGNADLMTLANKLSGISGEVKKQLQRDSTVNFQELRAYFPDMSVQINAGRDNPLHNFMQESNMLFETFSLNLNVSPGDGLRADGELLSLVKDTLRIDTVRLSIWQDTLGLQYSAGISKKRFRNQEAFLAGAHGYVRKEEADIFASYTDSRGEDGLLLGIHIRKSPGGFDFSLYPEKIVLAFLPFTVNEHNYFRFGSLKEMEADLRLEGDSQTSLWIHSAAGDSSTNEMMAELSQVNLEYLSGKFAILPSLKGRLNATLRYEPVETAFMIIADASIDSLYYENGRIGDLLMNATYIPMEKGTHQADLHVFHDMSEISSFSVLYRKGRRENRIEGAVSVDKLPLSMFNAMIPGRIAAMDGALSADFAITGTDKNPLIDGMLYVDKGRVHVIPSATVLRFDDKRIKVTKNSVSLDKYKIYALKDSPLVIDGVIDAADLGRPKVDLKISATNLQLVDLKKTPENPTYKRLSLNVNTTLTGLAQSLRMRGNLHILGSTTLACTVYDAPPEVQDGFNNLVTFTYFADTLPTRTRRPFNFVRGTRNVAAMSGTDVLLNIRIDPIVKIRVNLDEDQSNFVDLKGGGELSLHYQSQGDMRLNGRYTLSDGTIRYSIPVIPLTDFSVRNGSYVDWTGDPMNPYLNITAYARVRSAVDTDGQKKMVDFNAGIQLRNHLEDVSIQFILEAPSDAVVQNQLTAMGEEERSKQAISLLMTGVYLAGEGTGNDNLNVGLALNSLLQREIKNMLGNLLGDVPFSFDVETYDGTQQGTGRRVDYIGRFYKSFFNERFNTTLGLRYSTKDPVSGNALFIDDVSLEYLLDADGARAFRIFRNREYENLFEGEITKIGIGFSLSRKVKRFRDLFILRKQDALITEEEELLDESGLEETEEEDE